MSGQGPAGSRRRLGAELRRLRTKSGLHLDQVAARVPCSTSKISRLETGKGSPKPADVQRLMEIYGVGAGAESEMLLRLARDSRGHGWWERYTDGVTPERFVLDDSNRYTALEDDATAVRTFDIVALHGLVQTAGYARAVVSALLPHHPAVEIEQLVTLRLKRQEALTRATDPLHYSAVVDESVLSRVVGGPAVMREQLEHLLRVAEVPTVELRVLPFSAGMHRAHAGRFTILEFPEPVGPPVVYVEGSAGVSYLEAETDVAVYRDVLADAADRALDPAASARLVDRYLHDLAPRARKAVPP
jgi:transcriptional regulator with XRE-family HTH domain